MKNCAKCKVEKEENKFTSSQLKNKSGWCRDCVSLKNKEWRKENPEKAATNAKKWAKANPEKVRKSSRKWAKANPEKVAARVKRWTLANPERAIANGKKWKQENPEKVKAASKKWSLNNPEKVAANSKKYKQENAEKIAVQSREWQKNNSDKKKKSNKKWRENNPEKVKENKKRWSSENSEKILIKSKKWKQDHPEETKISQNKTQKKRYYNDPVYRNKKIISARINKMLKSQGTSKNGERSSKYLPWTGKELWAHLLRIMQDPGNEWMNADNQGVYDPLTWIDSDTTTHFWQLDHITPQSDLPYDTMDHPNFAKTWTLSNLRPYSAKQNILDGANRTRHQQKENNEMPSYEHVCRNEECKHTWEDFYSIVQDPPTTCPKCNQETAQRLISGGSGKGIVELVGNDLTDKIKQDTAQLKRDMGKDEKIYSNLTGEATYQKLQQGMDKGKREKYFRR